MTVAPPSKCAITLVRQLLSEGTSQPNNRRTWILAAMEAEPIPSIEKAASSGGPELGEERPDEELDGNQVRCSPAIQVVGPVCFW
jgi:hypothetical protein